MSLLVRISNSFRLASSLRLHNTLAGSRTRAQYSPHLSSLARCTTTRLQTRLYSLSEPPQQRNLRHDYDDKNIHEIDLDESRPPLKRRQGQGGDNNTRRLLDGLNPSQVEAVVQPTQAITRVIAGPGSGKTKVLTCRVAYLLEEDRRGRVLAVTFTRKAAGEMQQRVEALLLRDDDEIEDGGAPRDLQRVTLGTFHSICAKILQFNGELLPTLSSVRKDMEGLDPKSINLDASFAILDQSDQLRVVKECLDEAEIDLKKSGMKPLQVLNAIGQLKEKMSQGEDPFNSDSNKKQMTPKPEKIAKQVYHLYREKLFGSNGLDFDDLIYMTRDMLKENEDLRERLHRRWPHVLVDEFQDTSRSQMDLVKLLTSSSLLVVGDADQSIYSWRGAHAGSLSDFATEYNNVDTVHLKENYRSTSNIVKAAEKVISSSGGSDKSQDEIRKSMKPKRGSGPAPRVVACLDERAEANFVVDTVFDMLNSGDIDHDKSVAIIYRTNAQSRHLEEACVAKNLPYVIRGGAGGFYKRAEIRDCLCFLRWLYNGNDQSSMIRAVKTPSKGIGAKALTQFKEYCEDVDNHYIAQHPELKRPTSLDILISMSDVEHPTSRILVDDAPVASESIPKRALNNFLPFSEKMRDIREKAQTVTVDALLFYIIGELDLFNHFDVISKSKGEFEDRRANVQELRQAAKRYAKYGPALKGSEGELGEESALGNFLDDVALVSDIADAEASSEEGTEDKRLVVSLMTIHASKGMEFDAVFVVGNEEGTLPLSQAIQEGPGSVALEEEKRLCYVAMTRAKTRLLLTWRKEVSNFASWSDDGPKTQKKERSRFLNALVPATSKKTKSDGKSSSKIQGNDNTDRLLRQQQQRSFSGAAARRQYGQLPMQRARQQETPRNHNGSMNSSRRNSGTPGLAGRIRTDSPIHRRPQARDTSTLRGKNGSAGTNGATTHRRPNDRAARTPTFKSRNKSSGSGTGGTSRDTGAMDSTFIYPVGSSVVHRNFGKGKVMQPPESSSNKSEDWLVRIEFESTGRTMDFPVSTRDVSPDFLA